MTKYNVINERIKRRYLAFLKEAKGQSETSLDAVAKSLVRFESYTKYKDFKAFHFEQAIGFKNSLASQKHHKTGKPLSAATQHGTSRHLKAFFQWLSQEAGYKSRIKYSDAEYFNISEKDARIAKAKRGKSVASLEQIQHVLSVMPADRPVQRRDRALIAFTLLTGARDSAIASFKLKHVDLKKGAVFQDAREVKTKFSKTFTTYFFPVGDEVSEIVSDWVDYLKQDLLFGEDDPLFPKTQVGQGSDKNFQACGLARAHWSNADPIRRIFKEAFIAAGLPRFNPHSFRDTLTSLGQNLCEGPEEFKAWSQNLGHESVLTTFRSYGEVSESKQADIFKIFKEPRLEAASPDVTALAQALAKEMANQT